MNKLENSKIAGLILLLANIAIMVILPGIGILVTLGILLIIFIISKNKRPLLSFVGFQKNPKWKQIIFFGFIAAILIEFSFATFVNPLIEQWTHAKVDVEAFNYIRESPINLILLILFGWAMGGFIEEIVFRGYILNKLSTFIPGKLLSDITAILIPAFIFGYSHMYQSIAGMWSTGIIAIIFGIIFLVKGRNVWYVIMTHGFINTIGFTIIYFDAYPYLAGILF